VNIEVAHLPLEASFEFSFSVLICVYWLNPLEVVHPLEATSLFGFVLV
jgi:hypothetical protein